MDYKILSNKPSYTFNSTFDGTSSVEAKDLLYETINKYELQNGLIPLVVNKYYVARPDLISLAAYGTDDYADVICKINGISNPFELNEDMIIYIPASTLVSNVFQNVTPEYTSDFVSSEESTVKTKTKTYKKLKTDKRSSNQKTIADNNYTIDRTNNIIFY